MSGESESFPSSMLTETGEVDRIVEKLHDIFETTRSATGNFYEANEVYPNIFIGDGESARKIPYLKKLGITHVVNTAVGERFGCVNTNEKFYKKHGISFLGLELMDFPTTKISDHFDKTSEYIESALSDANNKVLVHCLMGISRSSTIVLAFLIMKRGMSAEEALVHCRKARNIVPNDGFLRQLAVLDLKLKDRRSLVTDGNTVDFKSADPVTLNEKKSSPVHKKRCNFA